MQHHTKEIISRFWISFAVIIFITVLLFAPFFTKGYIPMPGAYMVSWYEPWKTDNTKDGVPLVPHKPIGDDVFRQVIPFKLLALEEMVRGNFPLWNPYNGSGQPLLATIHSAYLNPFSYLLLLGDRMQGWSWYVLAQVVLTGFSMYWFATLLGMSLPATVVMVAALLLSGFMTVRLEYGVYGYAMASMALLVCGVELIRKKVRFSGEVAATGATAFLLITVQPQIFTYILAFVALYAFVRLWPVKRDVLRFYLLIALGIGIAAPQLLPMFELYRASNVTTDASRFIFERFLLPWPHMVTLGIPNYFGNAATYNWWGRGDFVQTMVSVGLIPVFLAGYVFFRRKQEPLVLMLGMTVIITMLLTVDWPFTRWFYTLPLPIISTNIPSRMYIVTTFVMSVLAGLGYMRLEKDQRPLRSTAVFLFVLFVIAAVTILLWRTGAPCPSEVPTCRLSAVRNTGLELGVFTAFGILAYLFRKRKAAMAVATAMLLLGVGVYNAQKNIPFSHPLYAMPEHGVLSFARSLTPDRIAGLESAVFATDFATQYQYFDPNYYDPLYIRRYGELVSYVNTGDRVKGLSRSDVNVVADATVSAALAQRRERFWDMTATNALIRKKTDKAPCRSGFLSDTRSCATLWEDSNWLVTQRETALPRVYLVSHVAVPTGDEQMLSVLFSPDTDIRKTAFIEDPRGSMPGYPEPAGDADIETYEASRVTITVRANKPAFLVLSDTYYPGWQARIDGEKAPVYRTNYTFRGVHVPQGTHTLEFTYEPESLHIGIWIAVVSAALWLGHLWWKGRKPE